MISKDSKVCYYCNKEYSFIYFYKDNRRKDGVTNICKFCTKIKNLKYKRSREGLISQMYGHQCERGRKFKYMKPLYSKKEFKIWVLNNFIFNKLFEDWIKNDYNINLTPSIDRINDYKNYSFDNIRIITWIKNKEKGSNDRKNGINNKDNVAVFQLDLNNNVINKFNSQSIASRSTNIHFSGISNVCKGVNKTAGGYKWKYVLKNK